MLGLIRDITVEFSRIFLNNMAKKRKLKQSKLDNSDKFEKEF